MQQVGTCWGGFPGRKSVIWFSGGFPLNIFQDISLPDPDAVQRQYEEQVKRTADQLTKAQVAIYPVEAGGLVYSLYDASSIPRNVYADAKTRHTGSNNRLPERYHAAQRQPPHHG